MPYSGDFCDDIVRAMLVAPDLGSVLDIGVGDGKYGRMARELAPAAQLTGIEIAGDYVDRFGLRAVYDTVRVMDACDLIAEVDAAWDLVILGDVIEHLRKSAGTDLLHYLVYRCKRCVVVWPEGMVQGSWEGHAAEAHISVWTPADFAAFVPVILRRRHKLVAAFDGYLLEPAAPKASDLLASFCAGR